ncbi:SOS-response transcriptional repressor LexA [Caulobacter ginsengisoli]|uniref:SOS-response transcriptional repressor LexA n=1 Tax=Caulobacter ginsengisoli TaxID=400775 RepID=A0ABU0IKR8_9CAUL|nr:S24 family peptidase [Caulobacter ginsengisoli]MDQ0462610.1 SOS-response transcriptional repressor LexA [Caulobacter ginsengisoli]
MGSKQPSQRARAFKAWMAEQGTNTAQVSARSGVTYTTLASFVQGSTQSLKGETEEKITAAYGSSAAVIFGGADASSRAIPVISWVAAGKLSDPDEPIELESETIEISGLEPGDYFGTRVRGVSMNRIAQDGALIIVNRADREPIRGRRYIFNHRGQTTFKRYGGADPTRLEPESTEEFETIFPKSDEDWSVIGRVRLVIAEV